MNNRIDKEIADKMLALPDSREQLEMIRELQDLERAVEALGSRFTKASDLIGVPVHIRDAWSMEITDNGAPKTVVVFQVITVDDAEVHHIMQSKTGPRAQIADYFSKFRAVGVERQLLDYQLVESGKDNGQPNRAVIWARAPKSIAAKGKK